MPIISTFRAMKAKKKSNDFDFDKLYEELVIPHFEYLEQEDTRRNNAKYSLSDVCKSGFAVYSLKSSSLLDFRPKTAAEAHNLKACFQINNIPSDNGLRNILDTVDSSLMGRIFDKTTAYLERKGILKKYEFLDGAIVTTLDGVHHYSSKKVKCDCCLTRQHRDGSFTYSHSMLSAAIVHPKKSEVFIVDNEPIVQQDGQQKNDCECNAAKRLFNRMRKLYASKSMVYVMDALYGCGPIIDLIGQCSPMWKFIINAKENGHKHLFQQFDQQNELGEVSWKSWRRKEGTYEVGWINGLALNATQKHTKVNMIVVNFTDKKGKSITFNYMTDIELKITNVMDVISAGRSRWKIENEVFNTLKNQQYNFEHNFGHGKQYLATNFAYLMLLAFTIDQMRQLGSRLFRSIWKGLKTKKATWDAIRTVFKMVVSSSIDDICYKVLSIYELRMIRV